MIKKVKNTVLLTYLIEHINGEEILETFMKKNCKRQTKQFGTEKVIRKNVY